MLTVAQIRASLRAQAERWGIDPDDKEALLAAAEMLPEWLPIEDAPKDGTQVLLFFPKRYQGKGGISWGCYLGGEWLDSCAVRDNDATHWMPLPEGHA